MTKEQVELIVKFDNWYNMHNVVSTFNHMGMTYTSSPEEYTEDVELLIKAVLKYPDLPVYEAYEYYKKNPDSTLVLPSKGLGDTIYKITHATGLDKLASIYTSITGKPCGCSERQDALNKLIPYGVKESVM